MSRRNLFQEADLARALKVAQQAGVPIARIEIDATGRIIIVSHSPDGETERDAPDAVLEAVRKKIADRRAERAASRQGEAR